MFPEPPPRCLILALGNPSAGDDAAALEVAAGLLAANRWSNCTIREDGDPLTLIGDDLAAFDAVLVIDAVQSGAPPGTLHFFPLSAAQLRAREIAAASTHGVGLAEALALAEAMKKRLPAIFLLGIEGANFRLGSPMCSEVRQTVEAIVANFDQYHRALHAQPALRP